MKTLEEYEHMWDGVDIGELPPALTTNALPDGVILTCAADLTPRPIRWLWPGWLALGKLHILAGAPGQGKTTIATTMMATVTIGGRWPDGTRCEAGNVLIWSGEDDPADTLLPRLMAAGADRSRCFFVSGSRIGGAVEPFDPAQDLRKLLAAIKQIGGVKMIVVDPVVSAVTGDSHKNTEVRRALQPLVDLATVCDCVLLGITHFAKGGQGSDPSQRVVGSVAFTAVARVVMVAAKVKGDEENKDARVLARTKSNIGPDGGGFHYLLEQAEPLPGIHASHAVWGKAVEGTARELLTDPVEQPDGEEENSALDSAEEFLKELLKDGLAPTKYVQSEAKEAGISWITVRRASSVLKVKKQKSNGSYYWSLPGLSSLLKQVAQVAQPSNLEQVEQPDEQAGF